jgi:uncharacterized membrane protein YedE/YeeE
MVTTLAAIVTSAALAAGCVPHASLTAPAARAPATERLGAYERLSSRARQDTVTVATLWRLPVSRTTDFIALGDGSRVYHAEDLLAVVPPDSPTARAAERSRHARKVSHGWLGAVIAGTLVGTAFVYAGFASDDWDSAEDGLPTLTWVGLGLAAAGSLSWIPQMYYARVSNDEKVSAFATYNDSLRKQLSLCVDGLRVIDCAKTPTPSARP